MWLKELLNKGWGDPGARNIKLVDETVTAEAPWACAGAGLFRV